MAVAEFSGTINITTANTTGIVTGFYGSSYGPFCNDTSTCAPSDRCALDWDEVSNGTTKGWCAPSGTSCANDTDQDTLPEWHVAGYSFCNGTYAKNCTSGAWVSTNCNATGKTCVEGGCIGNVTTTTIPGSTSESTTTTLAARSSLIITSSIANFSITQGESVIKTITVKNNGVVKLYTVKITLTGIPEWYGITKAEFTSIAVNESVTYIINFSIPANATVKAYDITSIITASDSTAATKLFNMKVMPSNETVENEIKPLYSEYLSILSGLEYNITLLEQKGINTTEIRELFNSAMNKLNQTNSSLQSSDYFTASQLLQETSNLINDIRLKIDDAGIETLVGDNTFIIITIVIILIVVGGILAYLFWPEKYRPSFMPARKTEIKPYEHGIRPKNMSERLSDVKKNILKLKKDEKKEKKEKLRYEFKR
ncbi:MAG: hypothetical protein NT129_04915 [Candidatus Aenigmarchaeota archaeon]|nr:hypothetical protein [Candidatus Aenigmarchaeota archaeon]